MSPSQPSWTRLVTVAGGTDSLWAVGGTSLFAPWSLLRDGEPIAQLAEPVPHLAVHGDTVFFAGPNGAGFVVDGDIERVSHRWGVGFCTDRGVSYFIDRHGELVAADLEARRVTRHGPVQGADIRHLAHDGSVLVGITFAGRWIGLLTGSTASEGLRPGEPAGGTVPGAMGLAVWRRALVVPARASGSLGTTLHRLAGGDALRLGEGIRFVDALLEAPDGSLLVAAAAHAGLDGAGRPSDPCPPRLWRLIPTGSLELVCDGALAAPQRRGTPFATVGERVAYVNAGAERDEVVWVA